jgi:hypothetical protein
MDAVEGISSYLNIPEERIMKVSTQEHSKTSAACSVLFTKFLLDVAQSTCRALMQCCADF